MIIKVFEHCCVCSHQANGQWLLICRYVCPRKNPIVAVRKDGVWWNNSQLDLVCETTFACGIPTIEVVLLATVDVFNGSLMRCMTGTRCKQHHPWCVRCASSVVCNVGDGVINKIFGEVIASPIRARCGDMSVVAHNFRAVLVSLCIEESVEAVKPACKWPSIEGTSGACFGERCDMPFADHVIAISVRAEHFGKSSCFVCDLAAIAGVAAVEVGEATNTNRVMIATSE